MNDCINNIYSKIEMIDEKILNEHPKSDYKFPRENKVN